MGLFNLKQETKEKRQFDQLVSFLRSSIYQGKVNEQIFMMGVDRYQDFIKECVAHSETGLPGVRPEKIQSALSALYSTNAVLTYQKLGNVKEVLVNVGSTIDGLLLGKETVSMDTVEKVSEDYHSLSHQLHTIDRVGLLKGYCEDIGLELKEVQYILYKLDNLSQLIEQHNRNLQ